MFIKMNKLRLVINMNTCNVIHRLDNSISFNQDVDSYRVKTKVRSYDKCLKSNEY